MIGDFLLGSFVAYNCAMLALKMKYVKIENQAKENILENGLYHFTSKENAEKILEDGYIRPSGRILSLGSKKTFFFAGIPDLSMLRENIADSANQYEWTAIKINPDENDIANYKIRAYDDNSVIFKGTCNLNNKKVKKVELVLDLNQDGIPYIREKSQEELEKGYIPSEELIRKCTPSKNAMVATNLMKAYFNLPRRLFSKIFRKNKSIDNSNVKITTSLEEERQKFLESNKVKNYTLPNIVKNEEEKINEEEIER